MNFFNEFEKLDFESWKKEAEKVLKGKPFEKLFSETFEGVKVKPLYTKEDVSQNTLNEYPGFPSFSRSWKLEGNTKNSWKIVQRIECPNPREANAIIRRELERGSEGFFIKHFNYDFENPQGVIINSILDFDEIFKDIDLTKIHIHFESCFPIELGSFFLGYLEKSSFDKKSIEGSIFYDFSSDLLGKGRLYDKKFWMDNILKKNFNTFYESLPNFRSIVIDGTFFNESGSNAVHELAFTLSYAVEQLIFLKESGVDTKDALLKFLFKLSVDSDIFINLAKLRSFRVLWANIVDYLGVSDHIPYVPIYVATASRNKSKLDIYSNMLRNICETFVAILGTADYIEVIPYDYYLVEPSEFSYRNATNTQLVLKEEHNLKEVIDPAGGSWYLEALTYELAQKTLQIFKEIMNSGGFFQSLTNGIIQQQINDLRAKRLSRLSKREDVLIGVNKFPNPEDSLSNDKTGKNKIDYQKLFVERKLKLSDYQSKQERNTSTEKDLIEIAKSYSSLDSIINFEYYKNNLIPIQPIKKFRFSEVFENIRKKSLKYKSKFGNLPKVLIIPFGKIADFRERINFTQEFFLVGGFDVVVIEPVNNIEKAFQKLLETNSQIVVFCSSNEKYPEFVVQLSTLIKKFKPLVINVLAGLPSEEEAQTYQQSGVEVFIHLKSDIVDTFNSIYAKLLVTEQ